MLYPRLAILMAGVVVLTGCISAAPNRPAPNPFRPGDEIQTQEWTAGPTATFLAIAVNASNEMRYHLQFSGDADYGMVRAAYPQSLHLSPGLGVYGTVHHTDDTCPEDRRLDDCPVQRLVTGGGGGWGGTLAVGTHVFLHAYFGADTSVIRAKLQTNAPIDSIRVFEGTTRFVLLAPGLDGDAAASWIQSGRAFAVATSSGTQQLQLRLSRDGSEVSPHVLHHGWLGLWMGEGGNWTAQARTDPLTYVRIGLIQDDALLTALSDPSGAVDPLGAATTARHAS